MDLSQLRYFDAVARHGSFSAASRALGITQPGLTKAIRRLEASLDCHLFRRLARGVALTEQGSALLRHSNQIRVQLQDARAEVGALSRGAIGCLRIGAGPSWLTSALPGVIARMARESPGLSFRVVGTYRGNLIDLVRNGDLDLAVSALPALKPRGLRVIPLTEDTLSVIARKNHPLRAKRRPTAKDALRYPWVLPARDVLSRVRLEALFRVAGLEPPEADIEVDSIPFIASVIRDSDMLSFMTSQIVRTTMGGAEPLAIPGLSTQREAGLILRASAASSPATLSFIEAMKDYARRVGTN